ncbi:phosphotransferase system enzyme I (PtsP) [Polymorphobacter multimanifer]|uniref:phosphoenolpyruvate--protein phosphotransferase n=1 Tax=Polymorphobacter multimanifer TaxID=1070431 RepID=A0A841LD11_9SPHN|nr:phosphoenolpyruvate--protein phosphotransferase [Polymorphobacter multimanifer]MBB6227032.1 phosphotransferase system enzyme I (PtsP) [Polymorphobacter multimanifer]
MPPVSAAREILRRLHEVMASRSGAEAKLGRVVRIVAEALSSEVASIYLLREGKLELFATQGLAQEAVHVTRLAMGQGLVGVIAARREPLNLAEAQAHPDFAYRPETGEERFHSFAGVPIVRREAAIGVLAVQHAQPREYQEIEIEALQTVAMALSELIHGAGLVDDAEAAAARTASSAPARLAGLKLVDGLARGLAVFHQPRVVIEHTVADDPETERNRVRAGFGKLREAIDGMMGQAEFAGGGDHQDVLETYKMFAYDEGWLRRINEAIETGLTAEAAIDRVQAKTRARMRSIEDPYLRERLTDLDDLANRLLRIVAGQLGTAAQQGLQTEMILIARNLGPAELLEYDRRWLKGVVLEEGSLTSHVTIVARAMGVPMLGRVPELFAQVADGDELIVDAANGALLIRPQAAMIKSYTEMSAAKAKRAERYALLRDAPAVTRDGKRVQIMMNAGLADDAAALDATGADGIGLFRTEFQFLVSATLPRRERQQALYTAVLDAAGPRPVIFRTIDIGGDKTVPYLNGGEDDENPAMGWRALRLALGRSGLMKVQARALLQAAAGRTLNVMFPMVSEPWEFAEARALVEAQAELLGRAGHALPAQVRYGAMIEVPAIIETLDELLPMTDFVSVGTNDLTQFLFAADRANPRLADRYDWLSPAILRVLRRIIRAAAAAGKPATVCGEMGGRPLEALALLALGVEQLSITPAGVGPIKAMVRSIDLGAVSAAMHGWLDAPGTDIRAALGAMAAAQGAELS